VNVNDARELLERNRQGHLLQFWPQLTAEQQSGLLKQIAELDFQAIGKILDSLKSGAGAPTGAGPAIGLQAGMAPAPVVSLAAEQRLPPRQAGEAALRAGRVGVILVAGGQGTRLGFDAPKGTYALAPITRASLFQIHARKILALERRYRAPVPFYVMTSLTNDADTQQFFRANGFFGLDPERVKFFVQGVYPAFLPDGRIVLEARDRLFTAPDGHGGVLAALKRTGMLDDMTARGLTTLFYFQVDNPLVEIADPVFLGLHLQRRAEMALKVCAKRDPVEGLGVVVVRPDGRYATVEYTELTHEQQHARTPGGDLVYKFGSVAIHSFALDFLRREADAGLPLHKAHKKVPVCDAQGRTVKPETPNAFKFEKFIFDALPDAANPLIFEFARADEFAPVKNAEGNDTPDSARAAMMEKFARWLEACGVSVPRQSDGRLACRLEIDPAYANSADELRERLPRGFAASGDVLLTDERA
jgi:UDP-N-acetylglucosamine/UDP-N-acetylgalactosamine diphosphorylase